MICWSNEERAHKERESETAIIVSDDRKIDHIFYYVRRKSAPMTSSFNINVVSIIKRIHPTGLVFSTHQTL